jgi:hypothetical protein
VRRFGEPGRFAGMTASIGKTIFTKLRQRRPDGNMIVPYWGYRGAAFGLIYLH